jgi:hypothetical protein
MSHSARRGVSGTARDRGGRGRLRLRRPPRGQLNRLMRFACRIEDRLWTAVPFRRIVLTAHPDKASYPEVSMRRAVLALSLGGFLLTVSACGTATGPSASGTPNTAGAAAAADPALADTRTVCEAVGQVLNKDIGPFADALGKMVAGRDAAAASASRQQAQQSLKTFSASIRGATQTSTDARLRADGKQAADILQAKSADAAFFKTIQTTKDMDTLLGPTLKEWLSPVTHHCS